MYEDRDVDQLVRAAMDVCGGEKDVFYTQGKTISFDPDNSVCPVLVNGVDPKDLDDSTYYTILMAVQDRRVSFL